MQRGLRIFAVGILGAALTACSVVEHPPQMRGQQVREHQLKELVPGTATEADATSLLGTPTAHATFDDHTWLYISEVTRPRVGQLPGVLDQEVVQLTFDQAGILRNIKRLSQDDGRDIAMDDNVTPSPGSSASFMQQLFGNIGRYSPGGFLGSALSNNRAPSGGVPNMQ